MHFLTLALVKLYLFVFSKSDKMMYTLRIFHNTTLNIMSTFPMQNKATATFSPVILYNWNKFMNIFNLVT